MALANLEATKLKHDDLTPAHLMLGLIGEGNCVATEALRVLDVDLDRVREEVCAQLEEGRAGGTLARRVHSKALKEIITLAIQEARKLQHRYVGTEHLVIALLSHGDSIPARALRKQGVDLDTLRAKASAMLRSGVDESHDLAHSRHGDFEWVHQQELAKAFRSPNFWHAMILAVDSANRMGAGEVEPEHLLLALLRDETNGLSKLLAEKSVTADWLGERLAANGNASA